MKNCGNFIARRGFLAAATAAAGTIAFGGTKSSSAKGASAATAGGTACASAKGATCETAGGAGASTNGVFRVTDFGAKGDGTTKCTAAIQAAIDACNAAGGGTVEIPAGVYVSGSIFLKSNVDFYVGPGATIKGSPDKEDYNAADVCPQNGTSAAESSFGAHLILCIEQHNVTVRGPGTIDGNSLAFIVDANGKPWPGGQAKIPWRPSQMLFFVESTHLRLRDINLVNSPYWSCFLHGCTYVQVNGMNVSTIRNPHTHNGDGIDIDCCKYVNVSDCIIDTADDCITLRANAKRLKRKQDCMHVTISNCVLSSPCNAFRFGVGDRLIANIAISNIAVHNARTAVNFVSAWSSNSRGTDFRNIRISGFTVECGTFCRMFHYRAKDTKFENIHYSDVSGTVTGPSFVFGKKSAPFRNVTFSNVNLEHGVESLNVEGFRVEGGSLKQIERTHEETEIRNRDAEQGKYPAPLKKACK